MAISFISSFVLSLRSITQFATLNSPLTSLSVSMFSTTLNVLQHDPLPREVGKKSTSTSAAADLDSLVANAFSNLSFQERAAAHDDVHGSSSNWVEETADLVASSLLELDEQLSTIKRKPAYDRAMFLAPSYVKSNELRLVSLRSEDWDPAKAAQKLVDMYEEKERFFGRQLLVRDVQISDLDANAQEALQSGGYVELGKDQAGRNVMCSTVAGYANVQSGRSLGQLRWYVSLHASSCVTENCKGTIMLANLFGLTLELAPRLFAWEVAAHTPTLPFRLVACHACMDHSRYKDFLASLFRLATTNVKVRLNLLVGSPLEVIYRLGSFGITLDKLSFDFNGNLRIGAIRRWLELVIL